MQDAVVIGGGFYGTAIAIYLKRHRGLKTVTLVEREPGLLVRASYNNQARVHNGYHYPRSFTTAFRSRVNLPRFVRDFPDAVKRDFTKVYAIARRNSKVTARQFERFCREIGATLEPAPQQLRDLFEPRLIEEVFLVEEYAFDSTKLADWAKRELTELDVDVRLNTRVESIRRQGDGFELECDDVNNPVLDARYVFNCTYSGLNQFAGDFRGTRTRLKHEITEMALVETVPELREFGVTVMDGPFFSMMPFPARGLHTLSHVRYTPHSSWMDEPGADPYERLNRYDRATRVDRMLRDVGRYFPAVYDARYVESLFEVKTVLVKNEGDDGRPILFEQHPASHGLYSILGGKIDNIYDVLEKLDAETFVSSSQTHTVLGTGK
ncbi:NAD(P)/FAD-dependent oxidoreductase [Paraburkholderia lacunae]|uniref:D amino acid oxidase (DAO) family protein n=1 Tax=Paraburkholderia lacunae TaxID=2211104 RepID=A0A370MZD9_9BURK|nr:FAD-dependent oxidoreductase [Paraburkholderia lacunae]RDJ98750.1 D amino acid oxidase (DAO) family protein [Paraburkholderia lacunae]